MLQSLSTLLTTSQSYLPQEVSSISWLPVTTMFWFILRWSLAAAGTTQASRVAGIIHAFITVSCGYPVLALILEGSWTLENMFANFMIHQRAFRILGYACCYLSCGYFLMDSAYIWRTPYLKHHIGAIAAWVLAAGLCSGPYVVHGIVLISLFETGAILVQMSRLLRHVLWFRTLICMGYTATRVALTLYYIFTVYTSYWGETATNIVQLVANVFTHCSVVFLVSLNWRWTTMQWQALAKSYSAHYGRTKSKNVEDFFTFHQRILGNSSATPTPAM